MGYYNQLATEAGITEDFNTDDFDVLFSGTRGNPEKAMELYIALHYDTSEASTQVPGVPAPPVLNDHTGGQAPPAAESYSSFDDAGKSLLAEIRASEGR